MPEGNLEKLRYPIGRFKPEREISAEMREGFLKDIEETPAKLRDAVSGLNNEQLNTPYRPGGWTVRQVVHHLPDSHLNSYIRFKWALTEDSPLIKTYEEARWAELKDSFETPIEVSLDLLTSLHSRWIILLRSLGPVELSRTLNHPEIGLVTLDKMIALYSWHGRHHVAHITSLKERMGW